MTDEKFCPFTGKWCDTTCALWIGEACSIAYIGASSKSGLRPWREARNDREGSVRAR